ncbi:ribonuclease R [Chelatococcus asaccharovorans]|uniref:ribonuclease R n=1 Tax=Chelatococcus asaccharovorans TaxID=28210 RepID=UPI0022652602|nr:ribonuclease R [Chelatococcus asaccharovorans]
MPKHRKTTEVRKPQAAPGSADSNLPSKEAVMAFLAEAKGKVGKREIARAFGIGGGQRIWLKRMLRELEDEGHVSRRGKRLARAEVLPPVVLADIIGRDRDGELLAEPVEWNAEDHGEAPQILLQMPRRPRPGQKPPGVGDRAVVRVEESGEDEGPPYLGRVIKVIEKAKSQVLGIFRSMAGGGGRLVAVDKRSLGRELSIAPEDTAEAEDGDLVAVSVARHGRFGAPSAKVRERLGSIRSERAISLIAIHTHGIPDTFSPGALREAELAQPVSLRGREDWRDLPLVTIDPVDAKDHDDAVHAAPDDDPDNPGGFVLTVAIADVAHYVTPGSALDKDALQRGNSVYFPDRVVPMLPERISNDLCSLKPHEDRPALAVRIIIDAQGRKKRHTFHRILMRSAAKLAYQQAQAAIDGHAEPDDPAAVLLEPVLRPLWAAYGTLAKAREQRGPLALELPERKLVLKQDGTIDRIVTPPRLDAHRLIEEFMILANVCAAEALEATHSPLIYRVHDEPSLEKMRALGEVLGSIGLKLPKAGALQPALFNRILAAVEETEHNAFVNEVVLRTQAQAEYSAENYGHFGLNLRRYAHFTSPIRRYADLVVHRALIKAGRLGADGLPASTTPEQLAEVSALISAAERRAMAAERETIERLIAHHLADRIGATFSGQISGVTKAGLFVKLDETGADGFIPAATLGADYFRYEEGRHALVGSRTGETHRLGDRVEVRLLEAAPVAGALRFELLSEGRRGAALRGKQRGFKEKRGKTGTKAPRERSAGTKTLNAGKVKSTWHPAED